MFSQLLSILLVLIVIILAPGREDLEIFTAIWPESPFQAFFWAMVGYGLLLGLFFLQSSLRLRSQRSFILVTGELLLFFLVYYFALGANRLWLYLPYFSTTVDALFTLSLYFFGITFTYALRKGFPAALKECRLLLPFPIPFLLLVCLLDFLSLFPTLFHPFLWTALTLLLMALLIVFIPAFLQKIWQCEDLEEGPLKHRLDALCTRARFQHGGFKIWTVMDQALTAAIVGVVPRFRYIMFTPRLLQEFPDTGLEAILAHEIGHNYRKHLWLYPLIFLGMGVLLETYTQLITPLFLPALSNKEAAALVIPLLFFVPYVLIILFYFRIIFGYFSRLFERQADLHVFALNIPAEQLVDALDRIGIATGYTHDQPNWHHYSIRERMRFLTAANEDPGLILAHHRRVKIALLVYFLMLILLIYWGVQ